MNKRILKIPVNGKNSLKLPWIFNAATLKIVCNNLLVYIKEGLRDTQFLSSISHAMPI